MRIVEHVFSVGMWHNGARTRVGSAPTVTRTVHCCHLPPVLAYYTMRGGGAPPLRRVECGALPAPASAGALPRTSDLGPRSDG